MLLALLVLQFIYALELLGFNVKGGQLAVFGMIILAVVPFRAPSYRLLVMLPLSRRAVEHMNWLFSGGLVAVLTTLANFMALTVCSFSEIAPLDGWRVTVLTMGTPGLIGVFTLLRRWSGTGINPANADRPLLLSVMFFPALLLIITAAPVIRPWAVIVLVVLILGSLILTLFLVSPRSYHRWIDHRSNSWQRSSNVWLLSPWWQVFTVSVVIGAPFGVLVGSTQCGAKRPEYMLLSMAIAVSLISLTFVRSIKVLRSLPWSIDRCTLYLYAALFVPPLFGMLSYIAVGIPLACTSGALQESILPHLAVAMALSSLMTGLSLRRALRIHYVFGIVIVVLWTSRTAAGVLTAMYREHVFLVQIIAVTILTATYFWLRHEIRTNAILYRYHPSGPLGANVA